MALANEAGRYKATVIDCGIQDSKSGLTTAVVRYGLQEQESNGAWNDISAHALEITGYHYFEKKDGTLNTHTIKAFKEAFKWDGRDVFHLETCTGAPCQVTLDWEQYDGNTKLRVQWLNAHDSEGGNGAVQKADNKTRQAINARIGSKLRALAGGGSPTFSPAPPPAPAAPPKSPPPKPSGGPVSDIDTVWAAFIKRLGADAPGFDAEWFALLKQAAGTDDQDLLTPAQWGEALGLAETWEPCPI